MLIRKLREDRGISQEKLAEQTQLSLRTIQRVEAGHRISYASLRALAVAFELNVDLLERELYAMNKQSDEFVESPLWLRLFLQKSWTNLGRGRAQKLEVLGICIFFILWITYLFHFFDDVVVGSSGTSVDFIILTMAINSLFWAYVMCLYIRLGDKYSTWSQWE